MASGQPTETGATPMLPPRTSVDLTEDASGSVAGGASKPAAEGSAAGAASGQRKSIVPDKLADSANAAFASFTKGAHAGDRRLTVRADEATLTAQLPARTPMSYGQALPRCAS